MEKKSGVITSYDALISYVVSEYQQYATELNALFFDIPVKMKKSEILEAYAEIQRIINGDQVVRLEHIETNGNTVGGEIADNLIADGTYEEIYDGNCKDFLKSFNGREQETGFCRYDENELLDFIW